MSFNADQFCLSRFLDIQQLNYECAFNEISNGKKKSHWMWYIFPQIKGLGNSYQSNKYAISSFQEARAYFTHPILGKRLIEISEVFLKNDFHSAEEILGFPDCLKMKSCMTLFNEVQQETDLFSRIIDTFYKGSKCQKTLQILNHKFD